MKLWIDAQLPPDLALWLRKTFQIEAVALRDLNLRDAPDTEIFAQARSASAVLMTKDSDFVDLVTRLGAPPKVLWLTCGNTSNEHLRGLLTRVFPEAIRLLDSGESVVELDG